MLLYSTARPPDHHYIKKTGSKNRPFSKEYSCFNTAEYSRKGNFQDLSLSYLFSYTKFINGFLLVSLTWIEHYCREVRAVR